MRSKFENSIARQIEEAGVPFEYEGSVLIYLKKVRASECAKCKSKEVYQTHRYTPDFEIYTKRPFFLESKGIFSPSDRVKMVLVREQHPKMDIRIVFQRDNWVSRKTKTRYSDWAKKNGFKYAIGSIPKEWLS